MKLILKEQQYICLSYTANAIPADALAAIGAKASAGMVLTPKLEYSISSIRTLIC